MTTIFSTMLSQLRKDAGFPTAYRFYHDNGGKPVLKISYRAYLMAEQGRILPEIGKLGTLIWALQLVSRSHKANAFVSAWLKTMAGEDNFKDIIEPLMGGAPAAQELSPMQDAMKKVLAGKQYCLSVKQVEAIYASYENSLCYIAITNDAGAWPLKEFAARLKLNEPAAKKALEALTAVKLVRKVKKSVYQCRISGMRPEFPHMNILPAELQNTMFKFDKKLQEAGDTVFVSQEIIRADNLGVRNFFSILDATTSTAHAYSVKEKTDTTALFMIEGKVTRLRYF